MDIYVCMIYLYAYHYVELLTHGRWMQDIGGALFHMCSYSYLGGAPLYLSHTCCLLWLFLANTCVVIKHQKGGD